MKTHDWKHCPKCERNHLGPHTCERSLDELKDENARLRDALKRLRRVTTDPTTNLLIDTALANDQVQKCGASGSVS